MSGESVGLYILQLVNVVNFIEDEIKLRMFQNVIVLRFKPLLYFQRILLQLLSLFTYIQHMPPHFTLYPLSLSSDIGGVILVFAFARVRTMGCFLYGYVIELSFELLVVLFELSEFAIEWVFLMGGGVVDFVDEEIVVECEWWGGDGDSLFVEMSTGGTSNKSLYWWKKCIMI